VRRQILRQMFLIVGAAAMAAAISNLTASAERRLDWIRTVTTVPATSRSSAPAAPRPETAAAVPAVPARRAPPPAKSVAPAAQAALAPPREYPPHPDKAWLETTPEETRSLFDRGVPFFDARRSSVYRDGHIRGARSLSVWEAGLDGKLEQLSGEGLDPSVPIVVYCSGGDCEDSHLLAERLWGIGLNNVLVYRDGFPDWERRGWPISKGETP